MMVAEYDQECGYCFEPFIEGETMVVYHSQYGWIHKDQDLCQDFADQTGECYD